MAIKVIITGATGMVGEGVLLECLENPAVAQVLIIGRKHYELSHPKLKELVVKDVGNIGAYAAQLTGYDGCFFCMGITSVGMSEADYTRTTLDIPVSFATTLAKLNPNMVFDYVSGSGTDGTEKSSTMWARVKGRAENELSRLPFRGTYSFRPGLMKATKGQKNLKSWYVIAVIMYPFMKLFTPGKVLTLQEVGRAMIHSVTKGYAKKVLEISDIKELAK